MKKMSFLRNISKKAVASFLAAALFITGPCVHSNAVTTSAGAIAKGIDVSKHNGVVDWAKVKNAGYTFAFIKIGSTYSGIDPMFHYNIVNAQANGIKTGVYIYSYASTVEEAALEANLVVSWLSNYSIQMPVVYDVENKKQTSLPTEYLGAMINTFCGIIDAAGYYPMVYSYKNFYNGKIGPTPWDKWAAQYGSQLDMNNGVSFWQYTSSGSVPGIGGRVDLNYQYKDYSNLIIEEGFLPHGQTMRFYSGWKMVRGWAAYEGSRYYMDEAGNVVTGLFTDADGKVYYLTPGTGAASVGATAVNDVILYFGEDGAQQMGFIDYGQGQKYFDPALGGAMHASDFFSVDNAIYYAGGDGTLAAGLTDIEGNQYYFNEQHVMQTGLLELDGLKYYFRPDGVKETGLVDYGKGPRYFDPALGGAMSVNALVTVNSLTFFAGPDGAFLDGVQAVGDTLRYFDPALGGAMAVGREVILDGVLYMAGTDGVLVPVVPDAAADPAAAAAAPTPTPVP